MEPLLIIAPSGSGDGDELGAALDVLRDRVSIEVCESGGPGDLDGILHRAGTRTIVVAGGDAEMHAVIATLHRRTDLGAKTLGLVPLRAGSGFARSAGIPTDPAEAAETLLTSAARPMDLIVDELGEIAMTLVEVGSGARMSRPAGPLLERLAPLGLGLVTHPLAAVVEAVLPGVVRLRIEIDGEVVADMDQRILAVSLDNEAPAGLVEVTVTHATDPVSRLSRTPARLLGRKPDETDVTVRTGSQVSIAGEDFWLRADRELHGPERRRTWHVESAAYRLLAPPEAD
ncbi:MAG: diacylglycerol kinase, catalytic region [Marmoricola sp.]|nr:diacylglycerol kinase, catalytic region [Marmoricola sp.]